MPQRTAGFVTGATPPGGDTATSGDVCGCQGVSWHRVGGSQGCHSAPHGARGGRAGGAPRARDRVLGCRKLRPLAMVSVGALHPKTNLKIVSKHVPLGLNLPEVPAPAVGLGPGLRIFGAPPPSAALHPDGARSGGAGGGRRAGGVLVSRRSFLSRRLLCAGLSADSVGARFSPLTLSFIERKRREAEPGGLPSARGVTVSKRFQWAAVRQALGCWLRASQLT